MEFIRKLSVLLMVITFFVSCSLKGLPPKLDPLPPAKPLRSIQVQGFPSGRMRVERTMAERRSSGKIQLVSKEIPKNQALFLDDLNDLDLAEYYFGSGEGDFQIVGEESKFKGGIKQRGGLYAIICYFTLLWCVVPWKDYAQGEVTLKIYDKDGKYLDKVHEEARGSYWSWYVGLWKNKDDRMGRELRDRLLKRVAIRTAEKIRSQ